MIKEIEPQLLVISQHLDKVSLCMPSADATPRILVVEDEFLIRMTLAEALGDEGFDVLEAESGDEAIAILRSDPSIKLLLTDIQLPGALNGRGLAKMARATLPSLPIIYMTGQPDPGDRTGDLEVFIAKPYTLSDICEAVRRLTS